MTSKPNIALIAATLAACASTVFAQTPVFKDDFSDPSLPGWSSSPYPPHFSGVNQQLVLSVNFGPANTNNLLDAWTGVMHPISTSGPLPDNQTLELRADLGGANQADAAAGIHYFNGVAEGYVFMKSENVLTCFKFFDGGLSGAVFFWTNLPVKNQNVTLVLALTRHGSSLEIRNRVLDKDNANAVLFERTVTDTPLADPVLPNRAAGGFASTDDRAETPWPVINASGLIVLSMTWLNPARAPQGAAQVTSDNAQVWQYESPELTIQKAVVLSWPAAQAAFVLGAAFSLDGPWAAVPNLWSRTNDGQTQVCVPAPDSQRFFRLLFNP